MTHHVATFPMTLYENNLSVHTETRATSRHASQNPHYFANNATFVDTPATAILAMGGFRRVGMPSRRAREVRVARVNKRASMDRARYDGKCFCCLTAISPRPVGGISVSDVPAASLRRGAWHHIRRHPSGPTDQPPPALFSPASPLRTGRYSKGPGHWSLRCLPR